MSGETYNLLAMTLMLGSLVLMIVAGSYLVGAVIGWKGPYRNRRLIRFGIAALGVPACIAAQQVLLFYVFLPSLGKAAQREMVKRHSESSLVKNGEAAPSFAIQSLNGGEVSMEQWHGDVVLLVFFATWCGPCLQELPNIQKIWEENRGKPGFRLLVVGREETEDVVSKFVSEKQYTFPVAADPDRAMYSQFAKEFIPRSFLIAPDGTVSYQTVGMYEFQLEELKQKLAKALSSVRKSN